MAEQILQADLGQVFKLLRFDSVAAFLRNLFGNLRNVHDIACGRHFVEAENFDRAARACGFDVFALIVHHCTNPAVCNARNNGIADFQSAVLHKNGCNRTSALVELSFNDGSLCRFVRVCLKVKNIRLQKNHFKQLVKILLFLCGNGDAYRIAAPILAHETVFRQLLFDSFRVALGLVDLVHCNDDGNTSRL